MQINPLNTVSNSQGIQSDVAMVRERPVSVELPPLKGIETGTGTVDSAALRAATDKINRTMQGLGNNLEFTVDSETSMNIVKVVDKETNKTIRQFPSEEALAIAKTLDKLQGMLIRAKA
ncbi:MAG: flagellar protein FlaG [Sterolibacterium sp.]|jgi:flagellar protein FlaG